MFGRKLALGERRAKPHRDRIVGVGAVEPRFEAIEQTKFFGRRERCVIGNVVGGAHEIVERQDRRAIARMNEKGRNREILIPVALARPQCARFVHRNSEILACARPFHMPPRPRAC